MKILAIETSCDETAFAVVTARGGLHTPKFVVERNDIASQIPVHRPFGGVVPNLAKREHLKNLPVMLDALLTGRNKVDFSKIDLVAVTVGPGLAPALWTGIEFAKQLAKDIGAPLLGVNHMQGHLYSNWLRKDASKITFPAIALVVSGGHTMLLAMQSLTKWKKLGETRDDAVGEAFDKVARLLKLPYPGGPEIQKLGVKGNKDAIDFPRPMLKVSSNARGNRDVYDFSFSGLKTAVLYYVRDTKRVKRVDVAASFQEAAVDVLTQKTMRAVREHGVGSVLLCGGVAANKALRSTLKRETTKHGAAFFAPDMQFNTDNAAMIAAAAYIGHLQKKKYRIMAQPNLTL